MTRPISFQNTLGTAPENYQKYFVPAIGEPLAAELVDVAALRAGERVLDVACGTGIVARLAAAQVGAGGAVTGADINPGMLATARASSPAAAGIEWLEANAEQLPLPEASFDVVLCSLGLQFVVDKPRALAELRRLLVPGGRIACNAPGPTPEIFTGLEQALARHAGPEAAAFVGRVFSLHDVGEIRSLLTEAGFVDVDATAATTTLQLPPPAEFLWQYLSSTPLAPTVAKLADEQRAALERDLVKQWQPHTADGGLRLQLRLVVATAHR